MINRYYEYLFFNIKIEYAYGKRLNERMTAKRPENAGTVFRGRVDFNTSKVPLNNKFKLFNN
jgi:hypothetical protein